MQISQFFQLNVDELENSSHGAQSADLRVLRGRGIVGCSKPGCSEKPPDAGIIAECAEPAAGAAQCIFDLHGFADRPIHVVVQFHRGITKVLITISRQLGMPQGVASETFCTQTRPVGGLITNAGIETPLLGNVAEGFQLAPGFLNTLVGNGVQPLPAPHPHIPVAATAELAPALAPPGVVSGFDNSQAAFLSARSPARPCASTRLPRVPPAQRPTVPIAGRRDQALARPVAMLSPSRLTPSSVYSNPFTLQVILPPRSSPCAQPPANVFLRPRQWSELPPLVQPPRAASLLAHRLPRPRLPPTLPTTSLATTSIRRCASEACMPSPPYLRPAAQLSRPSPAPDAVPPAAPDVHRDAHRQRAASRRRRRFSIAHAAFAASPRAATIFRPVPLSPLDAPAWTHLQHSVHRHRRAQPPFPIAHAVPHALTLFGDVPPAMHNARTCGRVLNPPDYLRLAQYLPQPFTLAHATFVKAHPLRPSLPHLARRRRREWAARMSHSAARARIDRARDSKDASERKTTNTSDGRAVRTSMVAPWEYHVFPVVEAAS
ncbi:hypothetical protein C8F04DRAFT_1230346 [Mycena alexandri]|uniref:Uncharacterized protein n=1 Tax=Mycena alexandri TaxID=1745969 RepID=A0AAD6TBZ6_9AGAR|nr:hypothetical protein C8F04DRAFT_1230346 [Mycena alexandri]